MENLAEKTLAQIVTENYKAAEIFEKYDLDFCCKGKTALQKAAAGANVDLDKLITELNSLQLSGLNTSARFNNWDTAFLVDYIIENHHSYVKLANERLRFYTQKIARVHGNRHPELVTIEELFENVAKEMEMHMRKEEHVLFPYIKTLAKAYKERKEMPVPPFSTVANPIAMMEAEHEQAGQICAEIRKLSNNYTVPADGCNTYRVTFAELNEFERDLHQHVHLENNILFPKAKQMEIELSVKEQMSQI